jgi:alpha-mannosidase
MPNIETIYLIHHSHTDIGYTNDQPIVWELNTRFIDEALALAEKHADSNSDGAFKWAVETTSTLKYWLDHAPSRDIARFQKMEKAGRIEVTAMFAHLTPLADLDQLLESFQLLRPLRKDYGFTIKHAMNCDVNGVNWSIVDALLDVGLEGFTMAINSHFGGAVKPRPLPFLWQAPSGRTIPTFNGWPYDKGWREGIGHNAELLEKETWPRLQKYVDDIAYPLPILMLQSYHPYGDVGTAFDFTAFIDEWNALGKSPRIVMATPSLWWNAVKAHHSKLKTLRGDWTDFWNFGAISSARETAMNRRSREALRNADALFGCLHSFDDRTLWAKRTFERYREKAYWNLHLWDEHTWGADLALRLPEAEDTQAQWNHKANYAYTARSLSQLLQRDALADLARHVRRDSNEDILVVNPSPFKRTVAGEVSHFVLKPRGLPDDSTAGRHHQDRAIADRWLLADDVDIWGGTTKRFYLPPTEMKGLSYTVVKRSELLEQQSRITEQAVIETSRYRVTFDKERGGIASLYDKRQGHEWLDTTSPYRLGEYVHEQVADTSQPWARKLLFNQEWNAPLAEIPSGWQTNWQAKRQTPSRVVSHQVYETPSNITVEQTLEAPGCVGLLTQQVILPKNAEWLEFVSVWDMGLNTHPEATYILFPFNVANATARFDTGGQAVIPEQDQLPGVCRDYFTVQNWVDFSNNDVGVTIATPENPLVQLGDFHFGHYQQTFKLERSTLLGWVTNNYWETNFRVHQPGRVEARYRVLPYKGGFNEAVAHRFGLEAASKPLFQQLGEPIASAALPSRGGLLSLPDAPILTLHVKAGDDDSVLVRLLNASDTEQGTTISSSLLHVQKAEVCDALGQPVNTLEAKDGSVSLNIPPRRVVTVRLEVQVSS